MDGLRHLSWVGDVSADHDGSREWAAKAVALISAATDSARNELKDKECRDKKSWMSSVQLWNNNTPTTAINAFD